MRTYAEAKGREAFNWKTLLEELDSYKMSISTSEHETLCRRSQSWVTCACGNLCDAIPRCMDGEPQDELLTDLGVEFHLQFADRRWKAALKVLEEIEVRSTELLIELGVIVPVSETQTENQ